MATRASKALSLYKTILRTGRKWPVVEDREYIETEAKRLYRHNRDIKSTEYVYHNAQHAITWGFEVQPLKRMHSLQNTFPPARMVILDFLSMTMTLSLNNLFKLFNCVTAERLMPNCLKRRPD